MASKLMVSGGIAVMTLSLGALASGYPNEIAAHWKWLVAAAIAGVLVAIWGYFLRPSDKAIPERPQATAGASSPIGGSGDQSMTAGRDLKQIKAKNYFETTGPSYEEINKRFEELENKIELKGIMVNGERVGEPQKPQIDFLILGSAMPKVRFEEWGGIWVIDQRGDEALTVWVEQILPDRAETRHANRISAHLQLSFEEVVTQSVSPAYWIDEATGDISFVPGQRKQVLIGFAGKEEWISYQNPIRTTSASRNWRQSAPSRELGKKNHFPNLESFDLEVRIFQTAPNQTVTTLAVKKFVVKRRGEKEWICT